MKKVKVISYYTKDTPYEEVMNTELLPSLKKWGIEYDIQDVQDKGSWSANTNYKATFILEMLKKHKCPVVFLDADATIKKFPSLFYNIPDNYDIGVHFLDWYWFWRKIKGGNRKDLLSGTFYLAYNDKVITFIEKCIKQIYNTPKQWEQRNIQAVLRNSPEINIYELPYSYIVFPRHDGKIAENMIKEEGVVIYHSQASRKFKK